MLSDYYNAETETLNIQAYEILEDITSIIACQEKSYAFPMPFADTAWTGIIHMPILTILSNLLIPIKSYGIFLKTMILHDKDNYARFGIKT